MEVKLNFIKFPKNWSRYRTCTF